MQLYSEADVDISCLQDKQISILGYGSQGRAHALNLKDSGLTSLLDCAEAALAGPKRKLTGCTSKNLSSP